MHSSLSQPVQGGALVGGKSSVGHSSDQGTLLTKGCIIRFSEIEQIAVLSVIILHYRVTVLEEPQYAREMAEERKMRLLEPQTRFVVRPARTPVVFTPRGGEDTGLLVDI